MQDKTSYSKPVLWCSALISSATVLVLIYLLWRGPPAETYLARHMYLRNGFIFYPLCSFFALFFAWIALDNLRSLIAKNH